MYFEYGHIRMMLSPLPPQEANFMGVPQGRSYLAIRLDIVGRPNCIFVMGAQEAVAKRLLTEDPSEMEAKSAFIDWLGKAQS